VARSRLLGQTLQRGAQDGLDTEPETIGDAVHALDRLRRETIAAVEQLAMHRRYPEAVAARIDLVEHRAQGLLDHRRQGREALSDLLPLQKLQLVPGQADKDRLVAGPWARHGCFLSDRKEKRRCMAANGWWAK
jgi:hypothetical protein